MAWQSILEDEHEYVRAIGMISIENANLELMLGRLFAEMLDLPLEVGQAIYLTPKAAIARLDVLKAAAEALYRVKDLDPSLTIIIQERKADLEKIRKIAARSEKAIGRRHKVIHDSWGLKGEAQEVARQSIPVPAGVDELGQVVKLSELTQMIETVRTLIDDVSHLAGEMHLKHLLKQTPFPSQLLETTGQTPG